MLENLQPCENKTHLQEPPLAAAPIIERQAAVFLCLSHPVAKQCQAEGEALRHGVACTSGVKGF